MQLAGSPARSECQSLQCRMQLVLLRGRQSAGKGDAESHAKIAASAWLLWYRHALSRRAQHRLRCDRPAQRHLSHHITRASGADSAPLIAPHHPCISITRQHLLHISPSQVDCGLQTNLHAHLRLASRNCITYWMSCSTEYYSAADSAMRRAQQDTPWLN